MTASFSLYDEDGNYLLPIEFDVIDQSIESVWRNGNLVVDATDRKFWIALFGEDEILEKAFRGNPPPDAMTFAKARREYSIQDEAS